MEPFKELDVVWLPERQVRGTIVAIHNDGEAYTIELDMQAFFPLQCHGILIDVEATERMEKI